MAGLRTAAGRPDTDAPPASLAAPPREARARRLRAHALAAGAVAGALLMFNTAARRDGVDYSDMSVYRRLWTDIAVGTSRYLDGPLLGAVPPPRPDAADPTAAYRAIVVDKVTQMGIRPYQFWRAIRPQPFDRERGRPPAAEFDDQGRAMLLGVGYRLLGGVSPFLVLWLGALLAVPVLTWSAWELFGAGEPVAGVLFPILVASSCFVVDVLSLPRSAVGFYVLALLLLVPVTVHAVRGRSRSRSGFWARAAASGLLLGILAVTRAGALVLLPFFVLAFAAAARRLGPALAATARGRALAVLGAAAMLLVPYLALREPQHHETWASLWAGLGDFDRTKGHTWSDAVAEEAVRAAGGDTLKSPRSEAVFRRLVLGHVREDPSWFAGILARRAVATVTQKKLWPRASRDGLWMARSDSPNEGLIDKYYTYTATVDFVGLGRRTWEMPIALLILPTAIVLLLAALGAHVDAGARVGVLAWIAAAALALPVLITTAGAQEPQAFALVYFLGTALLPGMLIDAWRARGARRGSRSGP